MEKISFDKVLIVYNEDVQESLNVASFTLELLRKLNVDAYLCSSLKLDKSASFVITIGGDGTLLKVARFYAPLNVPIFGINLGRLGFLAQANIDEIELAVNKLVNAEYKIENRMMLESNDGLLALNDIVIKSDSFSRTSKLFLSINDKVVCDYLADGIIVATPTGSTAYTLSAGGPVVAPDLDAIVIVPICAHTLTSRPLVIPSTEEIKITSCKTCNKLKMSVDGQTILDIDKNDFVLINRSNIRAKLVILENENNEFYSILRKKLQWGVAPEQ